MSTMFNNLKNFFKRLRIPKGTYCYTRKDGNFILCPYWKRLKDKPSQLDGYCDYLKMGDDEIEGFSLLFDQVKECGVKNET